MRYFGGLMFTQQNGDGVTRDQRRARRLRLTFIACLLVVIPWAGSTQAQTEKGEGCRDDITADDGYVIRSVRVKARYLPYLPEPLPSPGRPYSPVTVTKIVEDVHQALRKEANRENEEGETELALLKAVTVGKGRVEEPTPSGAIALKLVTSCTKEAKAATCKADLGESNSKCVDVTIH